MDEGLESLEKGGHHLENSPIGHTPQALRTSPVIFPFVQFANKIEDASKLCLGCVTSGPEKEYSEKELRKDASWQEDCET
jgi:hypothetical protein